MRPSTGIVALLLGMLCAGCSSGDTARTNSIPESSSTTTADEARGNPTPTGSPPSGPPPGKPTLAPMPRTGRNVTIHEGGDSMLEALHRNWSWSIDPDAESFKLDLTFDGFNATGLQAGRIRVFLHTPVEESTSTTGGLSLILTSTGSPGGVHEFVEDPGQDYWGDWELAVDSQPDPIDAYLGSWRLDVEVSYR